MSDQDNPVGKVEIPVDSTWVPRIPQDPEIARLADQQREVTHLMTMLSYVRTLGHSLDLHLLETLDIEAQADCRKSCPNSLDHCLAQGDAPPRGTVDEVRAVVDGRLRQLLRCRLSRMAESLDGEATPHAPVSVESTGSAAG